MKNNKLAKRVIGVLNKINSDMNIMKSTVGEQYIFFNIFCNDNHYFLFIKTRSDIFNLFIREKLSEIGLKLFNECLPEEEKIFDFCSYLYRL